MIGPHALGLLASILIALCLAFPVRAQLSGSATLATDERLFGFSLTDGRPVLRVGAAYDHPSGFYVGGSVAAHDPAREPARILGHTEYLGFAHRTPGGLSWDAGVNNVDLTLYLDRRYHIQYNQLYVGASKGALDAHLYVSPNYPDRGAGTAYLDVNSAVRPAQGWRLSGHAGALVGLGGTELQDDRRTRYDVKLGVAREWTSHEISLGWTAVFPRPKPKTSWTRPGLVLSATYFF
ncbi:MAG: TorF family putative porin [Phenylobacterium sp.]